MTEVLPAPHCPPTPPDAAPPCLIVIFGARGDLTHRLLIPALLDLAREGLLAKDTRILGVDHHEENDGSFRNAVLAACHDSKSNGARDFLHTHLFYQRGDFTAAATFDAIARHLPEPCPDARAESRSDAETEKKSCGNAIFYLATAPRFFETIIDLLSRAGLLREENGHFRRIIIEKPFGRDLASAQALNKAILRVAAETQIYRIDHYLGKETVQNIMVLRFANFMFEPIWDRSHIDAVEITAAETVGVEGRGRFYDTAGALRDMVPNHMFQLLSMIGMEPPNSFDAEAIRAEKAKVLEAVRPYSHQEAMANAVRGQYGAGTIAGAAQGSYRADASVDAASETETFVALTFWIDNWRWQGVPFLIRTGKALAARRTEAVIHFRKAPGVLFRHIPACDLSPGRLILKIQPDEGLSLRFVIKHPGRQIVLTDAEMQFFYANAFKSRPSTGYETLLYDCLTGDPTLFQRADHVEAGWAVVQPFLDGFADRALGRLSPLEVYAAGSQGPSGAAALAARCGHIWHKLS